MLEPAIPGTTGFSGFTNAQCPCHGAPARIHCLSFSFSSGLSFLCESGGGMMSSSSVALTRRQSSLFARLPGTTAGSRLAVFSKNPSFVSRRRPALRALASGPWQAVQYSERMGRMSRLKATCAEFATPPTSGTTSAAMKVNLALRLEPGANERKR